jgi:hypothetical protein
MEAKLNTVPLEAIPQTFQFLSNIIHMTTVLTLGLEETPPLESGLWSFALRYIVNIPINSVRKYLLRSIHYKHCDSVFIGQFNKFNVLVGNGSNAKYADELITKF